MDSLQNLLGDYTPKEPPAIVAIKRYIKEKFNEPATVAINGKILVVTIGSASLANTLRFRLPELQKISGTKRKIILRINPRD